MKQGLFIISLDFELFWGVRDKKTIAGYGKNILGVREVIPARLDIFEKHGVSATFATVGFLFAKNKTDLQNHLPPVLPDYSNAAYSPYENQYLSQIGETESDDPYHYGWSLLEMIRRHLNQEIATHTFSHFYCLEEASLESFEADLVAAKRIAKEKGIEITSIVFPRNQYAEQHIAICRRLGIVAYRGNETSSIYQPRKNEENNKRIRAMRLLDSYLNLTGHHTFRVEKSDVLNIPASRFLRPYSTKLRFLEPLRLKRIKNSMTHAAKNKECFHLWWHPHNFGVNLSENLAFLEQVLRHYRYLQQQYHMQSKTMKAIAEEIIVAHEI